MTQVLTCLQCLFYNMLFYCSNDASKSGGLFGIFKSLSMSKTLTKDSMAPALDKMKDHLIGGYNSNAVSTRRLYNRLQTFVSVHVILSFFITGCSFNK